MSMIRKRAFGVFLFLLISIVIIKIPYFCTDGFRENKILFSSLPILEVEEKNFPLFEEEEILQNILSQKFFYLGKGRQAYVFESADQKYVIKFMRAHKYKKPLWTAFSSLFHFRDIFTQTFRKEQKMRYERAIESYHIAYDALKKKTGLIWMHLFPTDLLNKRVMVIDRMGRYHEIDLDRAGFIIQKKAESFEKTLLSAYRQSDRKKIELLLSSFLEMVSFRAKKGILNRDFQNGLRNSGCIGDTVIELDVGSYYKEPIIFSNKSFYELEMERWSEHLKDFVHKKMSEYFSFVDHRSAHFLSKDNENISLDP